LTQKVDYNNHTSPPEYLPRQGDFSALSYIKTQHNHYKQPANTISNPTRLISPIFQPKTHPHTTNIKMSSSVPTFTLNRTLSSEAVAAALKASPSLSLRTTNLDFKETQAPPPSPIDFDWSPEHSDSPADHANAVSAAAWRRGREEMRVGA
jgi:hypothetical protein